MNRFATLLLALLLSCSTDQTQREQLKNSKKLFKSHGDLYQNGAFEVPYTTMRLIPAGPETTEIAARLVGLNARQAFTQAVARAKESVVVVKKISRASYQEAGDIYSSTKKLSKEIHNSTLEDSLFLMDKSKDIPKTFMQVSWQEAMSLNQELRSMAKRSWESASKFGDEMEESVTIGGAITAQKWENAADEVSANIASEGQRAADKFAHSGAHLSQTMKSSASLNADAVRDAGKNAKESLKGTAKGVSKYGKDISKMSYSGFKSLSKDVESSGDKMAIETEKAIHQSASDLSHTTETTAKKSLAYSKEDFIQGYLVTLPTNFKKRVQSLSQESITNTTSAFEESMSSYRSLVDKTTYWISDAFDGTGARIMQGLGQAKSELTESSSSIGITLGAIKALGLASKAIFWDGLIVPGTKLTAGALGYTVVNAITLPTMLIAYEGLAVTQLAVKAIWNTAQTAWDITAPTATAALAGVFSAISYTGGKVTAGILHASAKPTKLGIEATSLAAKQSLKTVGIASIIVYRATGESIAAVMNASGHLINAASQLVAPAVEYSQKSAAVATQYGAKAVATTVEGTSKATAAIIPVAGTVASKSIEWFSLMQGKGMNYVSKGAGAATASVLYLGVPLVSVGLPTAGTLSGAAVGTAGLAAGETFLGAGETLAASSFLFGSTFSATTVAGGTVAAAAAGSGVLLYEIGKGLTVPAAYALGSGIILSYGELMQLGAQTLLAAGDVAYLVLSLEGPNWVLYGVKGLLSDGSNLKPGTVLDLEKMQEAGEEFRVVPFDPSQVFEQQSL